MLSLNRQLQRNIAEALNIVSSYDFPEKWTNLLPVNFYSLLQFLILSLILFLILFLGFGRKIEDP
jgi:hypothetical protein